jgi:3-isopropylmalate/(R)-2-methylmalate dehydratase small subunit
MEPFTRHTGIAAPLDRANVDTDQIIPAKFLKRIERTGFGEFLFFAWARQPDGSPNPDFVLNQPPYDRASFLIAGRNFGSGSSREHAPWALQQWGLKAIIAPSFADIFKGNCYQNGLLPVELPEPVVQELMERAKQQPGYELTVDLDRNEVSDADGVIAKFEIDPFRRNCLLRGLDDIGMTLQHNDDISAFEQRREAELAGAR